MNIKAEILAKHNQAQRDKIVKYVGDNKDRFDEMMQLFLSENYRITQRISWPVSNAAILHPQLIKPYLAKMIKQLRNEKLHVAVKRNTVRLLQFIVIPEKLMGETVSICFDLLNNPKEAIAVKAFCMTVIYNCTKKFPGLKDELALSIKDQILLPTASAGIKNRGNKVLKLLEQGA